MTYPAVEAGQAMDLGTQWYDGKQPDPLPFENQLFPTAAFDAPFDPTAPTPVFVNGFDARCYLPLPTNPPPPADFLLRPDIVNCCWQHF